MAVPQPLRLALSFALLWCFARAQGSLTFSALDLNTGILQLSFDTDVLASSTDVTQLRLHPSSTSPDDEAFVGQNQLIGPLTQISSGNNLYCILSATGLLRLKLRPTLAVNDSSTLIEVRSGLVQTLGGQAASGTDGQRRPFDEFEPDAYPPTALDVTIADGLVGGALMVTLTLNEPLSAPPALLLEDPSNSSLGLTLAITGQPTQRITENDRVAWQAALADPTIVRQALRARRTANGDTTPLTTVQVLPGTLTDRAGNTRPQGQTLPARAASVDIDGPRLLTAQLAFASKSLDLLFSEPVQASSVQLDRAVIKLVNNSTFALGPLVEDIAAGDALLILSLTDAAFALLQADYTRTQTPAQLNLTAGFVRDTVGLVFDPSADPAPGGEMPTPFRLANLVPVADSSAPILVRDSGVLDFTQGTLSLTTSQPLVLASIDPSALLVRLVSTDVVDVPVAISAVNYTNAEATALALRLTNSTLHALQLARLRLNNPAWQLVINSVLGTDVFGTATPGTVLALNVVPDAVEPVFTASRLLQSASGLVLELTSSEPTLFTVTEAPLAFVLNGVTIPATGRLLALSGANGSSTRFELNVTASAAALRSQVYANASALVALVLSMQEGLSIDAFGNGNAPVDKLPVDASEVDLQGPALTSVLLDVPLERLSLTFDEAVRADQQTANILELTLTFGSDGVTEMLQLLGRDLTFDQATRGVFVPLPASLAQLLARRAMNASVAPDLTLTGVVGSDVWGNPTPPTLESSRVPLLLDSTPPTVLNATYDPSAGLVRITFSEDVMVNGASNASLASTIALQTSADTTRTTATRRRRASDLPPVYYRLQNATAAIVDGRILEAQLGPDDRALLANVPAFGGAQGQSAFVSVAGPILDAFGNEFAGLPRSSAVAASNPNAATPSATTQAPGASSASDDDLSTAWIVAIALGSALFLLLCALGLCLCCRNRDSKEYYGRKLERTGSVRVLPPNGRPNSADLSWDPVGVEHNTSFRGNKAGARGSMGGPRIEEIPYEEEGQQRTNVLAGRPPLAALPPPAIPPPPGPPPLLGAQAPPALPPSSSVRTSSPGPAVAGSGSNLALPAAVAAAALAGQSRHSSPSPIPTRHSGGSALVPPSPNGSAVSAPDNNTHASWEPRALTIRHSTSPPASSGPVSSRLGSTNFSLQSRPPALGAPDQRRYRSGPLAAALLKSPPPLESRDTGISLLDVDKAHVSRSMPDVSMGWDRDGTSPGPEFHSHPRTAKGTHSASPDRATIERSLNNALQALRQQSTPKCLNDVAINPLRGSCVTALYDYTAQEPDELTIRKGEELIIMGDGGQIPGPAWCLVKAVATGEEGFAPRTYVARSEYATEDDEDMTATNVFESTRSPGIVINEDEEEHLESLPPSHAASARTSSAYMPDEVIQSQPSKLIRQNTSLQEDTHSHFDMNPSLLRNARSALHHVDAK
ncbi:uncharacterized protein MONBRDRAFT_26951 [Monosiga brevicollis MX1]|uniref:SH3 domain-containing protein n=1 Tax=Monosiga brevicollis TaxID=81824 RepID=A9V407_MONBE|nr:uncharacterized protein MONBRDRAFT_26951 [Monosiga brevicollis MX1]EDQ87898.1 predicted protein [Monosiga brevicollis MX1]|eukprot:XP_001747431.1 hypothetical protein [Monosiga brevicollis MX1]